VISLLFLSTFIGLYIKNIYQKNTFQKIYIITLRRKAYKKIIKTKRMKTLLTLALGLFLFSSCESAPEETTEETTVVETEEVVATDSTATEAPATETAPEAEAAQ